MLTKRSWIVKEAVYSVGLLIAGITLNDLGVVVIALSAILIVIVRKTRSAILYSHSYW